MEILYSPNDTKVEISWFIKQLKHEMKTGDKYVKRVGDSVYVALNTTKESE